jgi:excisionase family DNA binding protein
VVIKKLMSVIPSQSWARNQIHQVAIRALLSGEPSHFKQLTLAEQIERIEGAMTAEELAKVLGVSKITIFKQAKAGRIPSFRIGTCVRFDPKAVANWLRKM